MKKTRKELKVLLCRKAVKNKINVEVIINLNKAVNENKMTLEAAINTLTYTYKIPVETAATLITETNEEEETENDEGTNQES